MTTTNQNELRTAALVTGFALFLSVMVAPFAELYAYPKLVVPFNSTETAKNIVAHRTLFVTVIFCYFITFVVDIVLAWSLFILLKPVNRNLALLAALFRLTYSIIALVALNNMVTVFQLLTTPEYLSVLQQDQLNSLAMVYLRAFRNHWYFGIIIFGLHLLLIGYLVYKSHYIPRILGIVLAITGLGYLLTSIRSYWFPGINVDFAQYTFYGELIFMLWLLIRGARIKAPQTNEKVE